MTVSIVQREEQLRLRSAGEVFCLNFSVLSWSDRAFLALSERIIVMNHQHIPNDRMREMGNQGTDNLIL